MSRTAAQEALTFTADELHLPGTITMPDDPRGLVVFVHGSGSSRHSPRNVQVAQSLADRHLATYLFDLLMADESRDRQNVFDIRLLAGRVVRVTQWLREQPTLRDLPLGYFGASTGAAAALVAAAERPDDVSAVVSRGGRPDLAEHALADVRAPTCLIVGSRDPTVLELNRQAQERMQCPNELFIVDGATHLFEEPGALEEVAEHAGRWFETHLHRD